MSDNTTASDFNALNIPADFVAILESMKITQPTEVQCETIPVTLSGSDLIAVAPTGSGKTLAYGLAVVLQLQKNPQARVLILSPTKETADQVFRALSPFCEKLNFRHFLAVPGMPVDKQANQLNKNPRLIVATPGRMNEQLQHNKLLLKGLTTLVLDEADRLLDGTFETQMKFILSTLRGERQTVMFAASFGKWAEASAKNYLKADPVIIRSASSGKAVSTLKQTVYFLNSSQKQHRLADELKRLKGGVLIFADSQENCVALGRWLEHEGFASEFIHGEMNSGHRNRVLREFREERMQILVTTDMWARGLDVPTIQHVISYDLPYKGEEFLHRIGRTARAGREGNAITFVTPKDGRTYRKLKPYLEGAEEKKLMTDFKFTE